MVIRGADNGRTVLSGAIEIPSQEISDAGSRLKGKARVIDLSSIRNAATVTRRGAYIDVGESGFELFQGDYRFRYARWPKQGYGHTIRAAVGPSDSTHVSIPSHLFERWKEENNLWLGGYWTSDWAFELLKLEGFDDPPSPTSAYKNLKLSMVRAPGKIRDGFRFFVQNALNELTEPGEVYLDEARHKAVFIPREPTQPMEIAVASSALILDGAHDLIVENIAFEKTRGATISIINSRNIIVRNCSVSHGGTVGVVIVGGENVQVTNCEIRDFAETGLAVSGGDRINLRPARHLISNSTITDFGVDSRTYRPGVQIKGVGITIDGCFISRGPHSGITLAGNDHVISRNEISYVVEEADDAGAIYTGRDWTERGNVIRENFIHDVGMKRQYPDKTTYDPWFVSGIYLDDQESGFTISGNVFLRVSRPVVIHGGRDNAIHDNAFLLPIHGAIWIHKRGEGLTGGELQQRLAAVPFQRPPWSTRYPALANILKDDPASPLNNQLRGNLVLNGELLEFKKASDQAYRPISIGGDVSIARHTESTDATEAKQLAAELLSAAGLPFSAYSLPHAGKRN